MASDNSPFSLTSAPPKAENDHNVYILGAGFSVEAGFPVIKDFMNRMRDAAAWLEGQNDRIEELRAIERVLEFRLRASSAAYRIPLNVENVEELFSLAATGGDNELAKAMPLAIAATLDYARSTTPVSENQWFGLGAVRDPGADKPANWGPVAENIGAGLANEQPKRHWSSCPPYDFYLGLMCGYFNKGLTDRRDTIITFNYELTIEDALTHLGIDFSYGVAGHRLMKNSSGSYEAAPLSQARTQLLKLHGSVNWCSPAIRGKKFTEDSQEESRKTKVSHFLEELTRTTREISTFNSYTELLKHPENPQPYLVPPTWSKSLTVPLTSVWDTAVKELSTATRIIILGYSIPPTDQHFRYLLAAGLRDNISLRKVYFVNPGLNNERTKDDFEQRLFGPLGLFRREHLEQGVIELIPCDLRQFLAVSNYRLHIGRPLNPLAYQIDPAAPWRCYPHSGSGPIFI
jgi:hypothetical protein